jgi:hypothetical protein
MLDSYPLIADGVTLLAILTPLSLAISVYKRTLVPLYALEPTQFLLNEIVFVATTLSGLGWFNCSLNNALLLTGVLLSTAPTTSYWVAAFTARTRDPLWGPTVTHMLVIAPIVYAFTNVLMELDVSVTTKTESTVHT